MNNFRASVISLAFAACAAAPSVHAIDLPPAPQDPQLATAFMQAQALLEKSGSGAYMDMPGDPKPWPCSVTELQVRKLAYVLSDDELDEKTRKTANIAYRSGGLGSNDIKTTVREVRFAPISANCKNGKLDGPLEFVIEFTRIIDMPTAINETRSRSRMHLMMSGGEAMVDAPQGVTTRQLSNKISFKDPAMDALVQKNKPPQSTVILASYSLPSSGDAGYSAVITETRTGLFTREWTTMLIRPTAPKRMENSSFRGASLWMVTHSKNGRMHGEARTYPATFGGVLVPGSMSCYEDGEEIKTTKCDVD